LPKFVSKCGDVLLFGRMSAMLPAGALMFLLCLQVSPVGVFKGLLGAFMSSQVIFFSVVLGAGTMCMGSSIMVLGSYLL